MIIDAAERPPNPSCPTCDALLTYVDSEISSGAFRPQAASMPQMPIHYYDCPSCKTCWKLGTVVEVDLVARVAHRVAASRQPLVLQRIPRGGQSFVSALVNRLCVAAGGNVLLDQSRGRMRRAR